jgi:hypothetical protein
MAEDGLQYYSGVGRGKGTIISPPNLTPIFERAGKAAIQAKQAKDKEVDDQQKWLNNALDLGDKGWIEDASFLDEKRSEFTNDYASVRMKYEGQKVPAEVAQELVNRSNKYKFIAQNSQKQRDQYYSFVGKLANSNLDDETRAEAGKILQEWVETPTDKRTSLDKFYLEKTFNYNDFKTGLADFVNKEAMQAAGAYGGQKYNTTERYWYTSLPTAQKTVHDAFMSSPNGMYARETRKLYEDFKKDYPTGEIDYTAYVEDPTNPNKIIAKTEKVTVGSIDDFQKYVQAPELVSMRASKSISSAPSISVGVSTSGGATTAGGIKQQYDFNVGGTQGTITASDWDENLAGYSSSTVGVTSNKFVEPSGAATNRSTGQTSGGSFFINPTKAVNVDIYTGTAPITLNGVTIKRGQPIPDSVPESMRTNVPREKSIYVIYDAYDDYEEVPDGYGGTTVVAKQKHESGTDFRNLDKYFYGLKDKKSGDYFGKKVWDTWNQYYQQHKNDYKTGTGTGTGTGSGVKWKK